MNSARALRLVPPDRISDHVKLAAFGQQRLNPSFASSDWRDDLAEEARLKLLEGAFVERERAAVAPLLADLPSGTNAFVAWYETLKDHGPGQNDPLFPWLAERATRDQMRWFLEQEAAGEAGFDDLVALTQVKLPRRAKLELARNYWDEMGRGNEKGMHGPMLDRLVGALELAPSRQTTVWQSLALGNLMTALACTRRYAFQSVGALGAIEMTAPDRSLFVARGLKRLGVPAAERHYFELHAVLDRKHSAAWNREALHSLVEAEPATARPLAEGALMRLAAGVRCFERYRAEFDLD